METVAVDALVPDDVGTDAEKQSLGEVLGTTDVALNRYRVEPGDRLAGLHAHADQEELFHVLDGALTFETLDGEVPVEAGETIHFEPGEFQSGKNESTIEATVLAVGAPRDTSDIRIPVSCSDCGRGEPRLGTGEAEAALVCPDCGAESSPRCSDCDGRNLRAVLGDDGETPVSQCQDCGATFDAST